MLAALHAGTGCPVRCPSAAAVEELVVDTPCILLIVATVGQTLRALGSAIGLLLCEPEITVRAKGDAVRRSCG